MLHIIPYTLNKSHSKKYISISMAMVQATKNRVSFIRQLRPCKDTWRIEVRIIRLWRNYNKDSGNTIEMVLADKEVSTCLHVSFLRVMFYLFLNSNDK